MDALDGNTVNVQGWNGDVAVMGSDKSLVPIFYKGTKHNAFKSQQQGVPVYDQIDMLKVYHPGEPMNVPDRPVVESDKFRFRAQWEAYEKGVGQKVSGTPLSSLFPHKPEIVKTLEVIHITTIQQLANLSDTAVQNVMFGLNLKQEAQKFLDAHDGAQFHAMQANLAEKDAQIKELNEKVAVLMATKQEPAPAAPAAPDPAIAALTQLVTNLQAQMVASQKPAKAVGWPKGKPRKPKSPDAATEAAQEI